MGKVQSNYDKRGSLGMVNMSERAEVMKAKLSIASAVGQGTRVILRFPLERIQGMTETQLWPVVWTLASMTLAVLVILFVSPALLARLHASLGGRLGVQLLRLLYFIGLPYAAC